ncbi:MAG: thiamine pyrophosphate-dependent enzyme, partial [Halobacteriales archaeon]|nr:thiamine pyrophosphate-dependent enzyme [Halobacteriales archaeon]
MPQFERGALQAIPHRDMAEAVTVADRRVYEPGRIREYLVEAAGTALDERGPAVVEIPTDVLRATADRVYERPVPTGPNDPTAYEEDITRMTEALRSAERPVAILGRGAREAASELREFVSRVRLPVLTTAGSKGVVPETNDYCVPGARGKAMAEADCYVLFGKRLDFTLGYGSPAIYGDRTFLQVDVDADALRRNRTADVSVRGTVSSVAAGLSERLGEPVGTDEWSDDLRSAHEERAGRMAEKKTTNATPIHPYRVCGAIDRAIDDDAIVICDGGDALSFGRVAIPTENPRGYLDPGPMGCLGVGIPFALGASLAAPDTDVVCFTGDGSFGFNAADIE